MFDMVPFGRNERSLFNALDNFEKNFFNDFGDIREFRTDILDKGDKYVLQAELPGFAKEDIRIGLDHDRLTVRAEHSEEKEDKHHKYVRRERRWGSFARSFDVSGINTDAITARYADGVLELELPKAQPAPAPAARQIDIE